MLDGKNLTTMVNGKYQLHYYATMDSQADILAPGYFDAVATRFHKYDTIIAMCGTTSVMFTVTSETQTQPVVIKSNQPTWAGQYVGGEYPANAMVEDGGWLMISNKLTSDRPAPLPTGDPSYIYTGTIGTSSQLAKQIIFGTEATAQQTGYLNGFRAELVVGNFYEFFSMSDPDGARQVTPLISLEATADGWAEFNLTPKMILEGTKFQIVARVREPDPTPTSTVLSYDYQKPNNLTPPLSGQVTQSAREAALLLVHKTDATLVDQSAFLATLDVGDLITLSGLTWAIQSITDNGTYYTFGISPATQSPSLGPNDFKFDTVTPTPITYPIDAGWWDSSGLTGRGLLGIDTNLDDIPLTGDFNGIDLLVQPADISPDWEFMSNSTFGEGAAAASAVMARIKKNK